MMEYKKAISQLFGLIYHEKESENSAQTIQGIAVSFQSLLKRDPGIKFLRNQFYMNDLF